MNRKRIMAMLLAVVMMFAMMPIQTRAEEIYTVTLKAGEGTGEDIVYNSNDGDIAKDWRTSTNCQFYGGDDNGMGFNLNSRIYFTSNKNGVCFSSLDVHKERFNPQFCFSSCGPFSWECCFLQTGDPLRGSCRRK